jgi:hypothetical protein
MQIVSYQPHFWWRTRKAVNEEYADRAAIQEKGGWV